MRYEAFLARYIENTFKLFLHSSEIEKEKQIIQSNFIQGGDIIRLKHTEIEGYLTADYCYEDKTGKNPEVYIRKYTGEYPQEYIHVDSLWEVEITDFNQRGNTCIIDDMERTLRLRHFTTGRLLMIKRGLKINKPILSLHMEN